MDAIQVVTLAVVQGLTEFLPISSSAHLVLVPVLTPWPDQGLAFDVAVHVGTLAAVLVYFRDVLARMARDGLRALRGATPSADARLAWLVLLATLPALAIGGLVNAYAGDVLRSTTVIAIATIGFALVLWLADAGGRRAREEGTLDWRGALLIGLAQALAFIPGTSRAGITITAGLALGLTRRGAARFSFLLSIPIIAAAGAVKTLEALAAGAATDWIALGAGCALSGACAFLCIHWFLRLVERVGLLPFVLYRLVLGAALLALA